MNITAKNQNSAKVEVEVEVDLSAAAAVSAVRGDGATATKTGTGTYNVVLKGNTLGSKLVEVLSRAVDLHGTPATAFNARITSITQATDGSDDITIAVTTLSNAATPAAADTTGACQMSISVAFRASKMTSTL